MNSLTQAISCTYAEAASSRKGEVADKSGRLKSWPFVWTGMIVLSSGKQDWVIGKSEPEIPVISVFERES